MLANLKAELAVLKRDILLLLAALVTLIVDLFLPSWITLFFDELAIGIILFKMLVSPINRYRKLSKKG